MVCIVGEFLILVLNVIISIFIVIKNWIKGVKKAKTPIILFHWERMDYIPTPDEVKIRNKGNLVKKKKKRYVDEYLERNLGFSLPKNLKSENKKNVKEISSDNEELANLAPQDTQGGVDLTSDVKVKFTKKNSKFLARIFSKILALQVPRPYRMFNQGTPTKK